MVIKKLLVFAFLVTLFTEALSTKEATNLVNAGPLLAYQYPLVDVTDHHIATAYFLESKSPSDRVLLKVKTYSLLGQELTSCDATIPWPAGRDTFGVFIGELSSLGNNETLVVHWIDTRGDIGKPTFDLSVGTLNTTNCKFTLEEFTASSIGFEREDGSRAFVVPYVDNFDLIFGNQQGKIVRARYGANGSIEKNPIELAENESSSLITIDTISKYSESKGYLGIYLLERQNFTAVVVNSEAKAVKRHSLLQVSKDEDIQYNHYKILGQINHNKLVLCNMLTETVECKRYNAENLEHEVSAAIKFNEIQLRGTIQILPDGGFWIWSMKNNGELQSSSEITGPITSSFTKINAEGHVEKSFETSHCNLSLITKPRLYYANEKICLAYVCEGERQSEDIRSYSTQVTCH